MGNIGESPNSALNVRDGPTCQSLYLLERLYVDVLALVTLVLGFSAKVAKAVFYELTDLVVNMNGRNGRSGYMKIKINLEMKSKADIKRVEAIMPRVIDNLQVYLRELQVDLFHSTRNQPERVKVAPERPPSGPRVRVNRTELR